MFNPGEQKADHGHGGRLKHAGRPGSTARGSGGSRRVAEAASSQEGEERRERGPRFPPGRRKETHDRASECSLRLHMSRSTGRPGRLRSGDDARPIDGRPTPPRETTALGRPAGAFDGPVPLGQRHHRVFRVRDETAPRPSVTAATGLSRATSRIRVPSRRRGSGSSAAFRRRYHRGLLRLLQTRRSLLGRSCSRCRAAVRRAPRHPGRSAGLASRPARVDRRPAGGDGRFGAQCDTVCSIGATSGRAPLVAPLRQESRG